MTKKEVINELELKYAAEHEEYKKQYDSYHSGAMAAIDEAIQIVEKLDDTEQKWIPVSKRLPEKDGYYFVTKRFMDGRIRTDIEPFWVGADWWKSELHFDGISLWEVFAWQPLPEPYKVGEKE
ncbi:MAG: DUF551 domain-containing protein [Lachnospiraceae bacterium]|nr:DUF551 domain-containing protein [Lachnospiraceae bacterium]